MRPELVVFDMAGTTVYDGDAVHASLAQALRSAGVAVSRTEINEVMGLPKPIAIRMLLEKSIYSNDGPNTASREELVASIHSEFQSVMLDYYRNSPEVREIEGATETFRWLKQAGIKVALDTGFSRPIADMVIQRLCWDKSGLIDATVTSDEVARGRPYPDMILRAMELASVSEIKCVAKVGDTPSDLMEGDAAGCGWVIGVTQGSHTGEELEPHPHTHLIRTVAELPSMLEPLHRS